MRRMYSAATTSKSAVSLTTVTVTVWVRDKMLLKVTLAWPSSPVPPAAVSVLAVKPGKVLSTRMVPLKRKSREVDTVSKVKLAPLPPRARSDR